MLNAVKSRFIGNLSGCHPSSLFLDDILYTTNDERNKINQNCDCKINKIENFKIFPIFYKSLYYKDLYFPLNAIRCMLYAKNRTKCASLSNSRRDVFLSPWHGLPVREKQMSLFWRFEFEKFEFVSDLGIRA